MPRRARGRPLPKVFRVLVNKGDSKPWENAPTSAERDEYVWLRAEQSVTSWGDGEKAHPINFFEQSIECEHCGCWRFSTTPAAKCCQNGRLVLNQRYKLGSELLDLAARGVSKVSRSLNNGYRFAQFRLPKDTHWVCDSYQHLKITGMPFAMVNNLNEASSTRSFLDDPLERQARTANVSNAQLRPRRDVVAVVDGVLSRSPLATSLINWANAESSAARLVLKWEGTTRSVRAFTSTPSTSVVQPRSIYFTRQADEKDVKIFANDPLYPVLMWPLAFPDGKPLATEDGVPLGLSNGQEYSTIFSVNQVTLALLMQPERCADGSVRSFKARSPYDGEASWDRPFSKLELFGRLGDEILLDRFLTNEDARLRYLSQPHVQKKLTGQFAAETEDDAADQDRGTYLPSSVTGSPRDMRDRVGNAMCARRVRGPPLLFITATTDTGSWEEILMGELESELEGKQDPFDRAGLTAEAFHGKLEALLARLRTGSIFRNVGRPIDLGNGHFECRFEIKGGGYLIWSIEYQGRGLVHAHIIWRPAKMPEGFECGFAPGQRLDWVDEWVCARIPDEDMLRKFEMLGPAGKFRDLDGIRSKHGDHAELRVHDYLWAVAPNTEVLHPDVVKDHGYGLDARGLSYDNARGKKELLDALIELTTETPATGPDGKDHWSLHPHRKGSHKGKMVHSHTQGMDIPDSWCKLKKTGKCKGHFPKPPAAYTHVSEEGWIVYKRSEADRMVVAYNPWISLYFKAHINVEVIATAHIFTYLFKYVLKGEDRNRAQVVVDGQAFNGRQGDANSSTHNRDESRNEIYEWRDVRETCAPQAYWRACEYVNYGQEPPCEKLTSHPERQRGERDKGFSDFEKYLQRPGLTRLNTTLFEEWEMGWEVTTKPPVELVAADECNSSAADRGGGMLSWRLLYFSRDANAKGGQRHLLEGGRYAPEGTRPVYMFTCKDARGGHVHEETYYCYPRLAERDRLVRLQRVPRTAGHAFYLRMLVKHVPARTFVELRTVGGVVHATFEESCRARGFLSDDAEARSILVEAIEEQDAPVQVRSLFAMLTYEGYPMASILSDTTHADDQFSIFEYMKQDFITQGRSQPEAKNLCLADLDKRLNHMGTSMSTYFEDVWCPLETATELQREQLRYSDVAAQRRLCKELALDTKPGRMEQTAIRNWCLSGDASDASFQPAEALEVGFCQGEAGTGKSHLAKHVLAAMRAEKQVALVSAATNLAATLFEDGWSLHALAKIPVEHDTDGNLFIKLTREGGKMTVQRLQLLLACALLIVDEGPCLDKAVLEALIAFLREKGWTGRLLIMGDLQQIPPVVVKGSRKQIVEASIVSSREFPAMRKFRLTKQYRAAEDEPWAASVRGLGDGRAPSLADHPGADAEKGISMVALPLVADLFHVDDADYREKAVRWVFGRDENGEPYEDGRLDAGSGQKAIIAMTNSLVNEWNEYVSSLLAKQSNATGREYNAWHELDSTVGLDAGDETLASAMGPDEMAQVDHADHSAPLGKMTVRVGDVMLLLKTLDKVAGLVKNARVRVVRVRWNAVEVALPRASGVETLHTIGRAYFKMAIKPGSPIILIRKQLPLKHAYAISANKSQGQTLDLVLFDARKPAFSGGQQYVVCSRVRRRASFAAVVDDANLLRPVCSVGPRTLVVANVVYTELLDALTACGADADACAAAGKRPAPCMECDSDGDVDMDVAAASSIEERSQRRRRLT